MDNQTVEIDRNAENVSPKSETKDIRWLGPLQMSLKSEYAVKPTKRVHFWVPEATVTGERLASGAPSLS